MSRGTRDTPVFPKRPHPSAGQLLSRPWTIMAGEVAIGCGESVAMTFLSTHIRAFRALHPQVQFRIYSANADDVKERIEKGLLDMGLLTEPVDIGRYAFLRTPQKDRWGVLVPKEHPRWHSGRPSHRRTYWTHRS